MLLSAVLIFFLVLGAVGAADSSNVSIKEDSNLGDNVYALSSQNKLEISNEVSISESNSINSQNDNLEGMSSGAVLSSYNSDDIMQASNMEAKDKNLSISDNGKSSNNNVLSEKSSSSKVPVILNVTNVASDSAGTTFKVSVLDSETGKGVSNNKVLLILNGIKYVGLTGNDGIAEIVTKSLAKGTYEVTLKYAGTISRYEEASLTKKFNVLGKVPVKMTVNSVVSDSAGTTFKVSVLDSETGKGVSNNKVLLILNGIKYVGTTGNDGIANIVTKSLAKGTYEITLKYAGTISRYEAASLTQKVNVAMKVPVKMTVKSAVSDSAGTTFKVSVLDSETGKGVSNNKVLLILNGIKYVGTTGNDGIANIVTKSLAKGTYEITLKYAGTISRYDALTITPKVSVSRDNSKSVWINADLGSDAMKNAIANLLRQKGWNVYVGETNSNAHYTDYFKVTSDYKYYITLYNGFCAGTVREAYSNSIQNTLKSKGVQLVIMWDTSDWTNPNGMKPYRYGDFTGYNAARAWDDNFSINDPSIKNVGAWLKSNNAVYCANPTAEGLVQQFLAGGYFAYSGK